MQSVKTTREMLCPRGLHRLKNIRICLDPNGQSNPRFCRECQSCPQTRSHHHKEEEYDNPSSNCMTVSSLNKLNSNTDMQIDDFIKFIKKCQEDAAREIDKLGQKLQYGAEQLANIGKSFDLYLRFMKEEGKLSGRTKRTSDLIRSGEWEGLTCQDIYLFKKSVGSQSYHEGIEQIKKKVTRNLSALKKYLQQVSSKLPIFQLPYFGYFQDYRFEDPSRLLDNGTILKQSGKYSLAGISYRKLLEVSSTFQIRAMAYNRLGRLHFKLRDREETIKFHLKNLQLTSQKATSLYNLAIEYAQLEDFEKAKEYYTEAQRMFRSLPRDQKKIALQTRASRGLHYVNHKLGIQDQEIIVINKISQSQGIEMVT